MELFIIKINISKECKYVVPNGSHTVTHIIKKVKGPSVAPGNSTSWENNTLLKVPTILPPTNLGGNTKLIEINYFLHVRNTRITGNWEKLVSDTYWRLLRR